jgi:integrase
MARKRGQNEGSIFKRKDGRWVAQVTIQSKQISRYFKSQREARDWLKVHLGTNRCGFNICWSSELCMGDYLTYWLDIINSSVRPKTSIQYKQIILQHVLPNLGRVKLKDLRPDQIQGLYNHELEAGRASAPW